MKKLILIFCIFLAGGFTGLFSAGNTVDNNYAFKHLDPDLGLSQSSVLCIIQDKTGFMWFGTKDGLNRYDGITFRVYKFNYGDGNNNENNLGNNVINSLYEHNNGDIWVGTDAGIYVFNPRLESFTFFDKLTADKVGISKPVYQIEPDSHGNLWISSESQGIFYYDEKADRLICYPVILDGQMCTVNTFCLDNEDMIWLGIRGKSLYFTDIHFKELKLFVPSNPEAYDYTNDEVHKIIKDEQNHLYIGTFKGGLKKINILNHKVKNLLPQKASEESVFIRNILNYSNEELFISTENGMYIYNKETNDYIHLQHNPFDPYSLADNALYVIYKDREGGIWIGSYFGGINYYPPQYTNFEKYYPTDNPNTISGRVVREFCEDNYGHLWIGTEDGGLNQFNLKTKTIQRYNNPQLYHNIHALCLDDNKLWIGTYSKGLYRMDLKTGSLKWYEKTNRDNSIIDNSTFSMLKTSSGDLYFGTPLGLSKYNRETDDFTRIRELDNVFVFNMIEDSNGHLWFASYTEGLFCFNPRKNTWKNYRQDKTKQGSLPYDKVISIYEDSKKRIWVSMQGGGFALYNSTDETFTAYNSTSGLSNDVVYKIIEDNEGIFWLTTNNGLVRFNPETQQFRLYTTANGLLNNQFNYSSGIKTKSGEIYFGGISGFIGFNPESFIENKEFSPVVLTDFFLFNEKAIVGGNNSPLKESITYSSEITLDHNQNSFAFQFAALSYMAPETNILSYKLNGFDKEWYHASASSMATYTNLPPGKYVFMVRSANNSGEWNDKTRSIHINIKHPFWQTNIAFVLYVLLLAGIGLFFINSFKKRVMRKQKYDFEKLNAQKEKEVYHAKIDFFTNVAHEIRTPLSLIKAPLEHIIKDPGLSKDVKEDLMVMEKNTLRLLDLTNQLLDFRKTETKGFSLYFANCNISELIEETYSRFNPTAKERGLKFEINLPETDFYAPVDREALTKILSNLFNNAIKYAHNYIIVELITIIPNVPDKFSIRVMNDGEPIPNEKKEAIFQPFVQLKNSKRDNVSGAGIGLALAKSLAELHAGSLTLEHHNPDICFSLELPIIEEKILKNDEESSFPENHKINAINKTDATDTTILIVEDNPEMLSFISRKLKDSYQIIQASNGLEAMKIIEENTINLIISDVMMPEMNGFELCERLKTDILYSHIPFILLTAKATLQSKIEGIELGADDYIEKPFSIDYLIARVANMLQAQEKRRLAFTSSPFVEAKSVALSKPDKAFLEKLTDIIHKNLAEPGFNVDFLAEQMFMSRSSLHRKIKDILKMTPNEFILLERLKKAAQMIQSKEYRINEICYLVGFNSSSYFAKCFVKQFGMLPKDFAK